MLPYWLRFKDPRTCPASGFDPGNAFVRRSSQFAPRICIDCLIHDVSKHGCAGWKRSHQLPNVYACAKHRVWLIDRCAVCGRPPRTLSSTIPAPLSAFCECGADLRFQRKPCRAAKWYWDLVQFSIEALTCSDSAPGLPDAWEYLRHVRMAGNQPCFHALLKEARTLSESIGIPLEICKGGFPTTREFCVYFSLLKITLGQALKEIRSKTPPPLLRASSPSLTLSTAADDKPIPSIAVDRAALLERFRSRSRYLHTAAYIRASTRDARWLERCIRETRVNARYEKHFSSVAARSNRLMCALRQLEASEPARRVTYALIGSCCGLSEQQTSRAIAAAPSLKAELRRINNEKPMRVLRQTALQMVNSGMPLGTVDWARRAKLPTTAEVVTAMRRIRIELTKCLVP
jgi:hypothetical protein